MVTLSAGFTDLVHILFEPQCQNTYFPEFSPLLCDFSIQSSTLFHQVFFFLNVMR